MFNVFDYILMGVYVLGLVILAFYLKKKAAAGLEDYFLGGKKLPWWALGISGMASQLDMAGTMIIVSLLYIFGPRALFIEIRGGLVLIMAFAMVYMGKWNRRSNCMTVAEWMTFRFGEGKSAEVARLIQAIARLAFTVGLLGYFVKGSGIFISMFLPFPPIICALIMVVVATVYTVMSGFYGVVFTDIFQSVFIVAAVISVSVIAFMTIGSHTEFAQSVVAVTQNADWFNLSIPMHLDTPAGYEMFQSFGVCIFFYFMLTIFNGASMSGGSSVYFGARNDRDCGKLTLIWILMTVVRWPMIIGFVILGVLQIPKLLPDADVLTQVVVAVKTYLPQVAAHTWQDTLAQIIQTPGSFSPELISKIQGLLGVDWQSTLGLISFHGGTNPEQILPAVIINCIPTGLRGLVLIALIAAAMSTFDSTVNMAAAYFVRDIYQERIRPKAKPKELIWASYAISILIVTIGFVFGYFASSINDIWSWICMGLLGGMALPGLVRWYWWRFNGMGFAAGTFAGLAMAIIQRIWWPDLAVWWQFLLLIAASGLVMVIVTYLTPPTDHETLRNFYRTTKPFGLWKPFKQELSQTETKAFNKEHVNDIISLFFAVPWQFLLYLISIEIMLHAWNTVWVLLIPFGFFSVGLYYFWYRNLPESEGK